MRDYTLLEIGRSKYDQVMRSYPIEHEIYRQTLNDNIFNYYQHYPVSVYNVDKWLSLLSARMAIIMPRYNLLYKSLDYLLDLDPLLNYDSNREIIHAGKAEHSKGTHTDETTGSTFDSNAQGTQTRTGSSDMTNSSTNTHSDTPQSNLATPPDTTTMSYYATDADYQRGTEHIDTDSNDMHSDTQNTKGSGTLDRSVNEDYDSTDSYTDQIHDWGTSPNSNYSKMLEDYRALAINIDAEIIKEIDDLFFTRFSPSDFLDSTERDIYTAYPYGNILSPWHTW